MTAMSRCGPIMRSRDHEQQHKEEYPCHNERVFEEARSHGSPRLLNLLSKTSTSALRLDAGEYLVGLTNLRHIFYKLITFLSYCAIELVLGKYRENR